MSFPRIAVVDYHKGNLSSVVKGLTRSGAHAFSSDDPSTIASADGIVIPGVGSYYDAAAFLGESGLGDAILSSCKAGKPLLGICLGLQLLFECGDEGVLPSNETLVGASLPQCRDNVCESSKDQSQSLDDCDSKIDKRAISAKVEHSHKLGLESSQLDSVKTNFVNSSLYQTSLEKDFSVGTVFSANSKNFVRGLGFIAGACEGLESRRLKVPHVGWDQLHLTELGERNALLRGVIEGANVYFTHSYIAPASCDEKFVLAKTHYVKSFPCVVAYENIYGVQFHPEKSSSQGLLILENFVSIVRGAC